ncbi:glycosyltransferase [Enterococcus canintestini]|uniref:glycosyltransferase n=1 Tax=Enterococcus canintestini TaxID=317010 RepID=UPI00288FF331|nr:glycosyltransferase [Enterococcus canintestini]MDT2740337.1 glycosyltransferase [Enterococcus canintestini]
MKIGIVLPYLSGHGGTETVLNFWIQHFSGNRTKVDVEYILPQGAEDYQWISGGNFKINNGSNSKNKVIRNMNGIFFLYKYVEEFDGDIVICLSTKIIKLVSLFKKIHKKNFKIISWIHFSLNDGNGINKKDLLLADFHLAISKGIEQQLLEMKIPRNRISVIGNPINRSESLVTRDESNALHLIYIGRIQWRDQKNLEELVLALDKLTVEWKLDVYGDGKDIQLFRDELHSRNLTDKVYFKGWVDRPLERISSADYLILTSNYEGFGMVLAESLAVGLPVISSDCPHGPRDIIKNGYNGFLYPLHEVKNLSQLLEAIQKGERNIVANKAELKDSVAPFYADNYFEELEKIFKTKL